MLTRATRGTQVQPTEILLTEIGLQAIEYREGQEMLCCRQSGRKM